MVICFTIKYLVSSYHFPLNRTLGEGNKIETLNWKYQHNIASSISLSLQGLEHKSLPWLDTLFDFGVPPKQMTLALTYLR